MNARFGNGRLAAWVIGLATAGIVCHAGSALAQTVNYPPSGPKLPKLSEMIDWTSVWERGDDPFIWDSSIPVGQPQTAPYNAEYKKRFDAMPPPRQAFALPGQPVAQPPPGGGLFRGAMPGFMIILRPVEILINPHEMVFITEGQNQVRRIYTDGRLPPADPVPTAAGYSIGHWKNKELIVETCCLAEGSRLPDGGPHSDAMHITERFYSPKPNMLVDEIKVEDPKAFTKPWTTTKTFYRRPDWEMLPPDFAPAPAGPDGGAGPGGGPPAGAPAAQAGPAR
ncbi:MAG TPA: hypothetical protein VL358_14645 [Caulobacteraceae bacterium]|jgi:hypothetical protein|nr:hypothetical protein [Caulobacteraceae bacterium]